MSDIAPADRAEEILASELPRLVNDAAMLVGRPFRFVWDPTVKTACTDCLAMIRVDPRPFLEGETEVGYGTVYHETGHIRRSPYGTDLIGRAQKNGGEALGHIMNIVLDRKDDGLLAEDAPGFAEVLRRRLLVICTMARREEYSKFLSGMSLAEQSRFLRHAKPRDGYEDFFFAAKWGKSPRTLAGHKAMKYMNRRTLANASPAKLLWVATKVKEILDQDQPKQKKGEQRFVEMCVEGGGTEVPSAQQKPVPSAQLKALKAVINRYVRGQRKGGTDNLIRKLKQESMVHPGPISVGTHTSVPVRKVPHDVRYARDYQVFLGPIQALVDPLVKKLRRIDNPSEIELYGREEGELDMMESARIATGLGGYYKEVVTERDIDAEIHLAIDASGSMDGSKIETALQIATLFSEAITVLAPMVTGKVWSFNSQQICDYGPLGRTSGFVTAAGDGGNSDTHMLRVVGTELAKSRKRRKVLLVLCDDGPDNMKVASELAKQLLARGIITVHLLVGVHGTPQIYPIELLYTSMEECLTEFGTLLESIISNLK
jgi:hypothetical protein